MNKARLLKLADLLEADAKNLKGVQFDLSGWGNTEDGTTPKIDCGTTACAIGLACLSPELQAEGLSFTMERDFESNRNLVIMVPKYKDRHSWLAVREFFDLSNESAKFLFSSGWHDVHEGAAAELAVAARIRDMVGAA